MGLAALEGEANLRALDAGNRPLLASCAVFRACLNSGLPVALGNPDTSLLWRTPPIQGLLRRTA
eukprot:4377240-Lingulodinium_polyedra.AAC.1